MNSTEVQQTKASLNNQDELFSSVLMGLSMYLFIFKYSAAKFTIVAPPVICSKSIRCSTTKPVFVTLYQKGTPYSSTCSP
jgi:hypothetical protein